MINIQVKRQESSTSEPYFENFVYEGDGRVTVSDFLNKINETLESPIRWERSCSEKKCGACAMLINGYPRLACATFLCDVVKKDLVTLAPLSKFPVLEDLVVDRTILLEILKDMKIYQSEGDITKLKEDNKMMYRSSKCILCGCCLEICPNFMGDNRFNGAFAMSALFKASKHNNDENHVKSLQEEYQKHFYRDCGQSLSCVGVCPCDVPHDELQAILNRPKH